MRYKFYVRGNHGIFHKNLFLVAGLMLLSILHTFYYDVNPYSRTLGTVNNLIQSDLSLAVDKHDVEILCDRTNQIVNEVRDRALLNETEASFWKDWLQLVPFHLLTCEQMIRSLPTLPNSIDETKFELQNLISLQRLSEKLMKLEQDAASSPDPLSIVVIGGSMSTGFVDTSSLNNDVYNVAFPRKLEQFMTHYWPDSSLQIVNLSTGGANEITWLGRLDQVIELDPDIILVESAVNDQCHYDEQDSVADFVNRTSFSLLNLLMNFPKKPAVISVELFRTNIGSIEDTALQCQGFVQTPISDSPCSYCPQWWEPQTWREEARNYNSVSHSSYRDAVWPIKNNPPDNLCSNYWDGASHPGADVHAMVASLILFQFFVVMEKKDTFLQLSKERDENLVAGWEGMFIPEYVCLNSISSYRALQGNPTDPFENFSYDDSCWTFRADKKMKYGWICEVGDGSDANQNGDKSIQEEYLRLSKKVRIGGDKKVVISRLVSYDDRMATAQVWFTSSQSDDSSSNIFVGEPVWDIPSWHEQKTSIPQPFAIHLETSQLKELSGIQWPTEVGGNNLSFNNHVTLSSTVEVILNIKILLGSSRSSSGIDKFKLLGIVTC